MPLRLELTFQNFKMPHTLVGLTTENVEVKGWRKRALCSFTLGTGGFLSRAMRSFVGRRPTLLRSKTRAAIKHVVT